MRQMSLTKISAFISSDFSNYYREIAHFHSRKYVALKYINSVMMKVIFKKKSEDILFSTLLESCLLFYCVYSEYFINFFN